MKKAIGKDTIAIGISIMALVVAVFPFWWNEIRKDDDAEVVILNLWVEEKSQYLVDMVFVNKGNTDIVIAEITISYRVKRLKADGEFEYLPGDVYPGKTFTPAPFTLDAGELLVKNYAIGEQGIDLPYLAPQEEGKYNIESYLNFIIIDCEGVIRIRKHLIVDQRLNAHWSPSSKEFPISLQLLPAPEPSFFFSVPRKVFSKNNKETNVQNNVRRDVANCEVNEQSTK